MTPRRFEQHRGAPSRAFALIVEVDRIRHGRIDNDIVTRNPFIELSRDILIAAKMADLEAFQIGCVIAAVRCAHVIAALNQSAYYGIPYMTRSAEYESFQDKNYFLHTAQSNVSIVSLKISKTRVPKLYHALVRSGNNDASLLRVPVPNGTSTSAKP